MTTLKKVILFLFGIVLVVFGNKAAINTIFGKEKDVKDETAGKELPSSSKPVVIEDEQVVPPVTEEQSLPEKVQPKPEKPKTAKAEGKPKVQSKEEVVPVEDVKEEVIEAPKTTIEADSSESATATE